MKGKISRDFPIFVIFDMKNPKTHQHYYENLGLIIFIIVFRTPLFNEFDYSQLVK